MSSSRHSSHRSNDHRDQRGSHGLTNKEVTNNKNQKSSSSSSSSSSSHRRPSHSRSHPTRGQKDILSSQEDSQREHIHNIITTHIPEKGTNPLYTNFQYSDKEEEKEKSSSPSPSPSPSYRGLRKFTDFPLSPPTLRGLTDNDFIRLTDIQKSTLPHGLCGRDIIGACRTGGGKTLCFVIPLLEVLWRNNWGPMDGVGGIILTPTRELALQIFDVMRKIGQFHSFSCGLIIGGKHFDIEQRGILTMNIIIATPGRLLQHMNETYQFDCSNLKMLIFDEGDRMLDEGFKNDINAIVENLPKGGERQTMLFSATQTRNVKELARLSLVEPEYITVHEVDNTNDNNENNINPTEDGTSQDSPPSLPSSITGLLSSSSLRLTSLSSSKLSQHYTIVECHEKFNILFSFLKTHLKNKILIFLSTAKQVKFIYEMFRKSRPGIPLLHLHGKMTQMKRMDIYYQFAEQSHTAMFCTDVAARGLDFPNVDWIVQYDCPDSMASYIHRVGRTARYRSTGNSLLFLTPKGEIEFLKEFYALQIKIKKVRIDPNKVLHIDSSFSSLLAQFPEFKYIAQRALISYLRSIHLMPNKNIFNVENIDIQKLSNAMGIMGTPKVDMRNMESNHNKKNLPYNLQKLLSGKSQNKGSGGGKKQKGEDVDENTNEVIKLLKRKNQTTLSDSRMKMIDFQLENSGSEDGGNEMEKEDNDDEEDDILKAKAHGIHDDFDSSSSSDTHDSDLSDGEKRRRVKKETRKAKKEENIKRVIAPSMESDEAKDILFLNRKFISSQQSRLESEDPIDKERDHERVHDKHVRRRMREKKILRKLEGKKGQGGVQLKVDENEEENDNDNDNREGEGDGEDGSAHDDNDKDEVPTLVEDKEYDEKYLKKKKQQQQDDSIHIPMDMDSNDDENAENNQKSFKTKRKKSEKKKEKKSKKSKSKKDEDGNENEGEDHDEDQIRRKKKSKTSSSTSSSLSLKEREKLALQMLGD